MFRFYSFFICLCILSTHANAQTVHAVASIFAPLQMELNQQPAGYAVDTVKEALKRLKNKHEIMDFDIKFYPWKRAIALTQSQANTIFFSISRTAEREDKYQWISEISPYEIHLFKLKTNRHIEAKNLTEAYEKNYRIGVQKLSNAESLIKKYNFKPNQNYITYSHYTNGIPMLFHNRFDMIPLTIFVARTNVCKLGLNGDNIESVMRVDELSKPLWLAANKSMSENLIDQLREELHQLKAEGFTKKVRQNYLRDWNNQPCIND